MWILCIIRSNGSMVDFGWPSGFTIMALYYMMEGPGYAPRRYLLCLMYIVCGLRFMMGWTLSRKHWQHEDKRWELWRERWRKGEGLLGIRNVNVNFFFFYHCQSMANVFVLGVPLHLACLYEKEGLFLIEKLAFVIWALSIYFETKADLQLKNWKRNQRKENITGGVCTEGLWKYSRHPNYFFEFCIWCSYCLYVIPALLDNPFYLPHILLVPLTAYFFLIHFTGVFMAEQGSLLHRGQAYHDYIKSTPMFFPTLK